MPRYSYEWLDEHMGRNTARLVLHDGCVYIETEGNHDGQVVCTSVKIARVKFAEGIKHIGGLL
jgi:hypothetical protein